MLEDQVRVNQTRRTEHFGSYQRHQTRCEERQARAISASPLYIVVPPTTDSMRHMVCPKTVDGNGASFTGLAGKRLTAAEKSRWETQLLAMVLSNEKKFIHIIGLPRTTAHLDRKLDGAALTMNLKQSILDSPLTFRPLKGQLRGLEDVAFKDTEIVLA
jgi:hypothetical protein